MKNDLVLLFISLIFLYVDVDAQINFRSADIVFANGSKSSGEINYKNWVRNPSKIVFRNNKGGKSQSFDPSTVASFTVSGETYKSAVVKVDERFDDIQRIRHGREIITRTDTLFLRLLVSGPKQLYHYYDNVHHFYIANGDQLELLIFKKYYTDPENVMKVNRARALGINDTYIHQLKTYFANCTSIQDSLTTTPYTIKGITNAFLSYYQCSNSSALYVHKEEKEKPEFGFLAGVSRSSLNIKARPSEIIGRVDFTPSTNFTGGIFLESVLPRVRSKLSIANELIYTAFKTGGVWRSSQNPDTYDEYTYKFGYSYIRLNNLFRYKFLLNTGASIFVNGGMSKGIVVKEINELKSYYKYSADYDRTTIGKGQKDTRKHEFGMVLGAGARMNRGSFELRAERGMGAFVNPNTSSHVMRYSALVGYRLF